jgi:hypothetical protein
MGGYKRKLRQKIPFKAISIDENKEQIVVKGERLDIKDASIKYWESYLYSYLEVTFNNKIYLTKGLKSVWEHLWISTYDSLEKREDNKIYNLYCSMSDLKKF